MREQRFDIRSRETRGRSRNKAVGGVKRGLQDAQPRPRRRAMTWNLGGMQMERLPDILNSLSSLLGDVVVVAFQEVNMNAGVHYLKAGTVTDPWLIVAGKLEGEWRGRATAVRRQFGVVAHCQTQANGLAVCVAAEKGKVGILNLHLPPKATLTETGKQLTMWGEMHAAKEKALMILGDFNETLTREKEMDEMSRRTARGALLTQWFHTLDMSAPPQQTNMPSYFPYNQAHRPRRLDYVLVRGIASTQGGGVHPIRQMAVSDHEGVSVAILMTGGQLGGDRRSIKQPRHGPKELKPQEEIQQALREATRRKGGPQQAIQQVANAITRPKRNNRTYKESQEVRQLRKRAKQAREGQQARSLWKQMWRPRAKEKEACQRELLRAVLREDWQALRATKTAKRAQVWEEELTTQEKWEETMHAHFAGIFARMPAARVKEGLADIWEQLRQQCKTTRWRPFSLEEVRLSTMAWSSGKSTGPDGISYEALRTLLQQRQWEATILEEFNDALYKGRVPANTKKSITILLPKTRQPSEWGETRPITLSSSMLKWQAQLLLARVGEAIMRDAKYQFARPGRQASELVLLLRRVIRICREWDVPIHVAKVDVSKAFDAVSQLCLAETIRDKLGNDGWAWEARLWTDLVENDGIAVQVRDEAHGIPRTNGVRQGSPDSPVIFACIVGDVMNEMETRAKQQATPQNRETVPDRGPALPHHTAGFQDDVYLWALRKPFLQLLLDSLATRLAKRNLQIHPTKTRYVHSSKQEHTLKVGGQEIKGEAGGTITVLGAPVALSNEVAACLGELSRRARVAYGAHKAMLEGPGEQDQKLKAYNRFVTPAALWAIGAAHPHDSLLKGANSIQLLQLRQMLRVKRKATEGWVEWNQRSLRCTRGILAKYSEFRWSSIILKFVWRLHGHIIRHQDDATSLIQWRNLAWWKREQQASTGMRHPHRYNAMLETERLLETIARPWQETARNRSKWASLEQEFISKFDVAWATGRQTSLENLAPN